MVTSCGRFPTLIAGDGSDGAASSFLFDSVAALVDAWFVAGELFDDSAGNSRGRSASAISDILFVFLT